MAYLLARKIRMVGDPPPTEPVYPIGAVMRCGGRIESRFYDTLDECWYYYLVFFHVHLMSPICSSQWVAQKHMGHIANDGEHLPSIAELRLYYRG